MSRRKRHSDTDENMKIYPDLVPGMSRGIMDSQTVAEPKQHNAKTSSVKLGNDTIKNNRGWSK